MGSVNNLCSLAWYTHAVLAPLYPHQWSHSPLHRHIPPLCSSGMTEMNGNMVKIRLRGRVIIYYCLVPQKQLHFPALCTGLWRPSFCHAWHTLFILTLLTAARSTHTHIPPPLLPLPLYHHSWCARKLPTSRSNSRKTDSKTWVRNLRGQSHLLYLLAQYMYMQATIMCKLLAVKTTTATHFVLGCI